MLQLIRVHEIDIFDIDVFLLTTEYLKYLRVINFDDLADAGAFISMASTLVEIKSRMLLPGQSPGLSADDGDEEDPRASLQERLQEYDRYKRASEFLDERPLFGVQIQTSPEFERLEQIYENTEAPLRGEPASLVVLYDQLLKDFVERKPAKVEAKRHMVSLEQIIETFRQYLHTVQFSLFQGLYGRFKTRYELVVSILAILELAKSKDILIYQNEIFGPIWVHKKEFPFEQLPLGQAPIPHSTHNTVIREALTDAN